MPKSTVHRFLHALKDERVLVRNNGTGKYSIGPMMYAIGSLFLNSTNIYRIAEPVLKGLNDIASEAISLAILERGRVMTIMRQESKQELRYIIPVGATVPAYASAMGKALLSELPESEIDNLYPENLARVTIKTIKTRRALKKELAEIKESSISFDHEGRTEGILGIASPVRDATGKVVAAMSVSIPLFRKKPGQEKQLASLIKYGAKLVSYNLGYQNNQNVLSLQGIQDWWDKTRK